MGLGKERSAHKKEDRIGLLRASILGTDLLKAGYNDQGISHHHVTVALVGCEVKCSAVLYCEMTLRFAGAQATVYLKGRRTNEFVTDQRDRCIWFK